MANKQSTPEIHAAAFTAAREKRALSVEQLALLACLSKKQIQQIENGGRDAFYSLAIKFTAAKKVAQLIQLDEKDAFDFGPQAELPLTSVDALTQSELPSTEQAPSLDLKKEVSKKEAPKKEASKKEAAQADGGEQKEANKVVSQLEAKPILVEALKPEPSMRARSGGREQKSTGKKWVWLLPVGALVLALVQFQPFLADQLDALMGKPKPADVVALTAAPVDATPTNVPAEPPASATPAQPAASAPVVAPAQAAPAIALSPAVAVAANPACPPSDASIENYKPPAASKPGNMVYVKMPTAQVICVEDGDGRVQSKAMEPSLGHSFYGKPPLKLLTSGLSSAEIFFQGYRVRPSNADSKSILLVQVD
jgi:transcriptional regulator with XRE-family HTH domain